MPDLNRERMFKKLDELLAAVEVEPRFTRPLRDTFANIAEEIRRAFEAPDQWHVMVICVTHADADWPTLRVAATPERARAQLLDIAIEHLDAIERDEGTDFRLRKLRGDLPTFTVAGIIAELADLGLYVREYRLPVVP